MTQTLRVAFVTGGHPFDVPAMHQMLRALPHVDVYPQHLEDWATNVGNAREVYDVTLLYFLYREFPQAPSWSEKAIAPALESLGTDGRGIVVWHHALLCYPQWDLWGDLTGLRDRAFGFEQNQSVPSHVVQSSHPIMQGLDNWTMTDEIYTMNGASDDCEVLVTTSHPRSMPHLAWTRSFRDSRVFCLQPGHDHHAFENDNFHQLLARGIAWSAHRI